MSVVGELVKVTQLRSESVQGDRRYAEEEQRGAAALRSQNATDPGDAGEQHAESRMVSGVHRRMA